MAKLGISEACQRLNALRAPGSRNVQYHHVYLAIAAGDIPAERDHTGLRWQIDEASLPAISIALGLTPTAPAISEQVLPKPAADKRQSKALVAKDGIESPLPSPCVPAAAPVGTAPPKRRGRSAVTPKKTSPGKPARSSRRHAA
jgi:hypothetical protein